MSASGGGRPVRRENSTAAKIRALAAQGRSRADIARVLGIRYQHVRNVLVRDEEKARAAAASSRSPGKICVASDGTVVVPAAAIQALELKQGDPLFLRVTDGEIHLLTRRAIAHRVQSAVRKFVPEGVSLVDELLEERRREAETSDG